MPTSISFGQPSGSELLCFCAIFVYFCVSHHISQCSKLHWVPETALAILLGLLSVGLMAGFNEDFLNSFDTVLFFKILLPPIIFVSGFKMNLGVFYQNLTTIMVFANAGTVLNAVVFALGMYAVGSGGVSTRLSITEAMSYGSVVSATDPVTTIAVFDQLKVEPALYTIVVAVSILDDAVSIIMFDLFNEFINSGGSANHSMFYYIWFCLVQLLLIFMGSVLVGIVTALAFAAVVKHTKGLVSNTGLLHCMSICVVYAGYLIADKLALSGIIASLFCGMALQRYTALFVKQDSLNELTHVVSVLAQFFETLAFYLIGCALLQNTPSGGEDAAFVFWSLLMCVASRAAQIYPLALLLNVYNKTPMQPFVSSHQAVQTRNESRTADGLESGEYSNADESFHGVQLSLGYQHVIMVAGLRGPIAFATSKLFPDNFGHRNIVAAASSIVVLATIVVFGPMTEPMLRWCGVRHGEQKESKLEAAGEVNKSTSSLASTFTSSSVDDDDDIGRSNSRISLDRSGAYSAVRGENNGDEVTSALHNFSSSGADSRGANGHDRSAVQVPTRSIGPSGPAGSNGMSQIPPTSRMHCSDLWGWLERMEGKYLVAHFLSEDRHSTSPEVYPDTATATGSSSLDVSVDKGWQPLSIGQ